MNEPTWQEMYEGQPLPESIYVTKTSAVDNDQNNMDRYTIAQLHFW